MVIWKSNLIDHEERKMNWFRVDSTSDSPLDLDLKFMTLLAHLQQAGPASFGFHSSMGGILHE